MSSSKGFFVLFATVLASGMAFLDSTALNVALPAMQKALDATAPDLVWIINSYNLPVSALILLGGMLGDRFGLIRVFSLGIGIFMVASLGCGLAPNVEWLIVFRALKGVGGALMIPGSMAVITASFPESERGKAIGTWSAFATLTTMLGPVLGGWLAGMGMWRVIFFLNLPLGLLSLWALRFRVPALPHSPKTTPLDWVGSALVIAGLGLVSVGLLEGGGGSSLLAWIGVAVLVGFFVFEARTPHPMMPLDLFRDRMFLGTNLLTVALYATLYGVLFFVPLNLVQVQGYSSVQAGMALLPFSILLTILSPKAGRWSGQWGPKPLLFSGPLLVGVGYAGFAIIGQTAGPSEYWTTFFPVSCLLGLGMGLTVAPLTSAVMSSAPSDRVGIASGINNSASRVSGVMSVAVLGACAINMFEGYLSEGLAPLGLSHEALEALRSQADRLAETPVPTGVPVEMQEQIQALIGMSFLRTFEILAWVGAGLSVLSALFALTLPRR